MRYLKGIGVSEGIAIGRIYVHKISGNSEAGEAGTPEEEQTRFDLACEQARKELRKLYETALERVGRDQAEIFLFHQAILSDPDFLDSVQESILSGESAEVSVKRACNEFKKILTEADSEVAQSRGADLEDIQNRLIQILGQEAGEAITLPEPCIVVAQDILPSETMRLDRKKVLAFVTAEGSKTSHAAILSRTMGIPAVTGTGDISCLEEAELAIVDGKTGIVLADPDEESLEAAQKELELQQKIQESRMRLKGLANETIDGKKIEVFANIGSVADMDAVLEIGADGIGLFRSEFLFMQTDCLPDEKLQFEAYREVLSRMGGRKVVVRTFDLGADKKLSYLPMEPEKNPALGLRAIRYSLLHPELLKTQLRALLRASVYGKLAIMFPMITSLDEVRQARSLMEACKSELRAENISFDEKIEFGIMIETPAAALISDILACEVDFFSVGTNDLTQYTLAVDRLNKSTESIYNPAHPAVLRLIEMIARNASEHGIWCGICGESAADPALTERYLAIGVTELSMAPPKIMELREKIRSINLSERKS
ncbi:MAG TPA: phosphoenolpyruvate--protein phosphotransferase [Bacillota bacterium]|nr:phosphoenolpyruvate--protein phosphotransferase [Bacillota bacterium]